MKKSVMIWLSLFLLGWMLGLSVHEGTHIGVAKIVGTPIYDFKVHWNTSCTFNIPTDKGKPKLVCLAGLPAEAIVSEIMMLATGPVALGYICRTIGDELAYLIVPILKGERYGDLSLLSIKESIVFVGIFTIHALSLLIRLVMRKKKKKKQ